MQSGHTPQQHPLPATAAPLLLPLLGTRKVLRVKPTPAAGIAGLMAAVTDATGAALVTTAAATTAITTLLHVASAWQLLV